MSARWSWKEQKESAPLLLALEVEVTLPKQIRVQSASPAGVRVVPARPSQKLLIDTRSTTFTAKLLVKSLEDAPPERAGLLLTTGQTDSTALLLHESCSKIELSLLPSQFERSRPFFLGVSCAHLGGTRWGVDFSLPDGWEARRNGKKLRQNRLQVITSATRGLDRVQIFSRLAGVATTEYELSFGFSDLSAEDQRTSARQRESVPPPQEKSSGAASTRILGLQRAFVAGGPGFAAYGSHQGLSTELAFELGARGFWRNAEATLRSPIFVFLPGPRRFPPSGVSSLSASLLPWAAVRPGVRAQIAHLEKRRDGSGALIGPELTLAVSHRSVEARLSGSALAGRNRLPTFHSFGFSVEAALEALRPSRGSRLDWEVRLDRQWLAGGRGASVPLSVASLGVRWWP